MNKILITCASVAFISLGYSTASLASPEGLCAHHGNPDRILEGAYSYHEQGISKGQPYAEAGIEIFDGNGNVVNHYVSGGVPAGTVTSITATYTISPDCLASVVYSDGTTTSAVVNPDGSGFDWVQTNTDSTIAGEDKRISKKID